MPRMEDTTAYVVVPPSAKDAPQCAQQRSSTLRLMHPAAVCVAPDLHPWPHLAYNKSSLAKAKLKQCLSRRRALQKGCNTGALAQRSNSTTRAVPHTAAEKDDPGEELIFDNFSPASSPVQRNCPALRPNRHAPVSAAPAIIHQAATGMAAAHSTTVQYTQCKLDVQGQPDAGQCQPICMHTAGIAADASQMGCAGPQDSSSRAAPNMSGQLPAETSLPTQPPQAAMPASQPMPTNMPLCQPMPAGPVPADSHDAALGVHDSASTAELHAVLEAANKFSTVCVQFEDVPSAAQLRHSRSSQVGGLSMALRTASSCMALRTASSCTVNMVAAGGATATCSARTARSLTPGSAPWDSSIGRHQQEQESLLGGDSGCGGSDASGPDKASWMATALGVELPLPEWAEGIDEYGYIKRASPDNPGRCGAAGKPAEIGNNGCCISGPAMGNVAVNALPASPAQCASESIFRGLPSLPVQCVQASKRRPGVRGDAMVEILAPPGIAINADHFSAPSTAVHVCPSSTVAGVISCAAAPHSQINSTQAARPHQVPQATPWYEQSTAVVCVQQHAANPLNLPPALQPVPQVPANQPTDRCSVPVRCQRSAAGQQHFTGHMSTTAPQQQQQQQYSARSATARSNAWPIAAAHNIAASVPSRQLPASSTHKTIWPWFHGLLAMLHNGGAAGVQGARQRRGRRSQGLQGSAALQHIRSLR